MTRPVHEVRICVVGSINIDLVVHCDSLPKPGETVVGGRFAQVPGGKGANQALAARLLGAQVDLVGAVGNDSFASAATIHLVSAGVDLSKVRTVQGSATGVALILVDGNGENEIAVASGANHQVIADHVNVGGYDAVLCQLETTDEALVYAANQATGLFVVNVAPAAPLPSAVLARANVIIANEGEYHALSHQLTSFAGLLVVTLGARGAVAMRDGLEVARALPPVVDVIDSVGAGDAFCGCLVVDLARGVSEQEALVRACVAGALATTREGAQSALPTSEQLTRVL